MCGRVFDGRKSSAEGIDLEFERDTIYYLVSIKSGPNWGNSGQIKKMVQNFAKARRIQPESLRRRYGRPTEDALILTKNHERLRSR